MPEKMTYSGSESVTLNDDTFGKAFNATYAALFSQGHAAKLDLTNAGLPKGQQTGYVLG